ncbi:MAG: DM13 domain-containing protein [Chloroflexi bacterium]|nr:DM13 domain-containing protein [Chloroflexota bacterium]
MKKRKHLFLSLILVGAVLALAACGQTASTDDAPASTSTPVPEPAEDVGQAVPTPRSEAPTSTPAPVPSPTPEQEPENARSHFDTANDLLKAGQVLEAIEEYDTVLSLESGFVDGYFNRGVAFLEIEEWEQAVADYTKVIELTPGDAGAYFNRGLAFLKSRKRQEAIADYSKVIELTPNDVDAYFNRGLAALESGKSEQAVADYTRVVEFSPDNIDAQFNLAVAYYGLREIDKFDFTGHTFGIEDVDTANLWNIYRGDPTPVSIRDEQFPLSIDAEIPSDMTRSEVEAVMEEAAKINDELTEAMPDDMSSEVVSEGSFRDQNAGHRGSGRAIIYLSAGGSAMLRLEDFSVTNGPGLHVFLSAHPDPKSRDDVKDEAFIDLGELKANMGNQNYGIPTGVDVAKYHSVVIYCVPFNVVFSVAPLDPDGI